MTGKSWNGLGNDWEILNLIMIGKCFSLEMTAKSWNWLGNLRIYKWPGHFGNDREMFLLGNDWEILKLTGKCFWLGNGFGWEMTGKWILLGNDREMFWLGNDWECLEQTGKSWNQPRNDGGILELTGKWLGNLGIGWELTGTFFKWLGNLGIDRKTVEIMTECIILPHNAEGKEMKSWGKNIPPAPPSTLNIYTLVIQT